MHKEEELTFRSLFLPLTRKKAISWIFIIGFIIFFNALFGKFVWDDNVYILKNPIMQNFNLGQLFGENFYNLHGYYRPLIATYFSFILNIFGENSFYFHLIQVTLHITNTGFVYLLFKKFIKNEIAFLISLIFLVHPLQVESVSWISATIVTLSFFFGILGLYLSIIENIKTKHIVLSSILFLLSILTRETGFLFIILAIIFQLFYRKKKPFILFLSITLITLIYSVLRFIHAQIFFQKNTFYPIGKLNLFERLINIPEVIFYYLKNLFIPLTLAVDQLWVINSINISNFYLPLLFVIIFYVLLALVAIYLYKNNKQSIKIYLFFLTWFLIGFTMIWQIFPLDMTVADRWFYFPFVGLLGILGLLIDVIIKKHKKYQKFLYILLITIICSIAIITINRNSKWNDTVTLFSNDIKIEKNYDNLNILAAELMLQLKFKEALPYLIESNRLKTTDTNLYNLGSIYEQLGDTNKAKYYYQTIINNEFKINIRENVKDNAYLSISKIILIHDTPEKSKKFFTKATKLYPKNSNYWAFLAISENSLNNKQEALLAAEKAKQIENSNFNNILYESILNNKKIKISPEIKNNASGIKLEQFNN